MNKHLKDLGAGLSWIRMSPEDARRSLQALQPGESRRDISFECRGQGAFAKAAER